MLHRYGERMRGRSQLIIGASLVLLALTGCATATAPTPAAGELSAAPQVASPPAASAAPTEAGTETADAAAQAQAWLDATVLPPGAVASDAGIAVFGSYTGWPCGPIEEVSGFWAVPDATVGGTAKWLLAHPPADMITTTVGSAIDDSTIVGFVPEPDAQEGIVYTIARTDDGVAVRAEVAALTASGVCPEPPGGGQWGAPGQG
ncbi:hypothetical protein N3K63_02635 [Microbacterium sp. W1N]|uniref:hypothetical protein n=1 Tax=Microbacterium festucae TaxID=2977531 RepID=UPI0021BFD439|nr:hypothetical protein [Microbacterium festucae]MCT9819179.1 hypothetical protein [Microbacterium festucae]